MELPGAHWIAIYFDKQVKGEFFDSYGKHPIHYNKHFLDFMNRNAVEWEHNKISFKVLSRLSVDNICIYFLYHWCEKRSMSFIVKNVL